MSDYSLTPHGKYVSSSQYRDQLMATRRVWSASPVVPTAGMMIFITYLTAPMLLSVHHAEVPRVVLNVDNERVFLTRLMGLERGCDDGFGGGIANARVRAAAERLKTRHLRMAGMRKYHMNVMAAVIALAPIQIARIMEIAGTNGIAERSYWSYAQQAMALIGARLGTFEDTTALYDDFVAKHCAASTMGHKSLTYLRERHPRHFERALTVLPGEIRAAATPAFSRA